MNNQYKVGDKIKSTMYGVGTIIRVDKTDAIVPYYAEFGNQKYWLMRGEVEPANGSTDEIHITVKGNKTIAVHKNNGKLVKRAEAICCPSDTFDFTVGAKLAMDRLLDDKPKEKPEPFKPYLECDGENYGIIGEKTEITAFAETPLNVGDVVEATGINGYRAFTSIVINSNGAGIMGYLSTSKNMKNGSFVNPYRERCYVRKIRDYTELADSETIRGVTVHLTEKGE